MTGWGPVRKAALRCYTTAVDEDQASIATAQEIQDADTRLAARLKQILHTPGISHKDRKLVEGNLKRLVEALERRKTRPDLEA